jgi:hypothetical protein
LEPFSGTPVEAPLFVGLIGGLEHELC